MNLPSNFDPITSGFQAAGLPVAYFSLGVAAVFVVCLVVSLIVVLLDRTWLRVVVSVVLGGAVAWAAIAVGVAVHDGAIANDTKARANTTLLREAARSEYGLRLTQDNALDLQAAPNGAVEIAPNVLEYGNSVTYLDGEAFDVALYRINGQWLLLDRAKVAEQLVGARLPLLG